MAAITEEQSRKRLKHSHGEVEQATPSIDRISDLPDSILYHILSYLRTNLSVRTSILSRRWRYLWAYVPNLFFHSENQEIVNSVMLLRRVQTINIFRLFHEIECTDYQLQTWVTFATLRNVQKIDLRFLSEEDALPRCLFTCKTLVALRLRSCGVIPLRVRGAVCLPHLKKLHLIYVRFEADESLIHLISGCPVLAELSINLSHGTVYRNVTSPTVKRLMLNFRSHGNGGRSDRLEINTPALEYLKISDSFSEHNKCGVLNSLVQADINLINDENKPDYVLYSRSLLEFIDRFCNVTRLKLVLSFCRKIVDSVVYASNASFRNLTKLELTADGRFLSKFLEKADNLEILIFSEFCGEIEEWKEPEQVPKCLLSHLKIVKLVNVKGKKHEFGYIEYLLWNAKVLERMEISYPGSLPSKEKIHLLHEISVFRRRSTACQVAFAQAA
ncbi:hypothetical protein ABFX02_13G053700 [Erythranthe guttata]